MTELEDLRRLLAELETRYQALEKKLREHPKIRREWTAIFISLLAAAFALWSAYETHRSVQAQVDAMQLSVRPFVIPDGGTWRVNQGDPQAPPAVFVSTDLKLIVVGSTPALSISVKTNCKMHGPGDTHMPGIEGPEAKILGVTEDALLYNRTVSVDPQCARYSQGFEDSLDRYVIVGRISYSDYFQKQHASSFCYEAWISGESKIHETGGKLEPCAKYPFTMT